MFNRPDKALFRQALTKAGFYADWKRVGAEAWAVLEKYSGGLRLIAATMTAAANKRAA